MRQLKPNQKSIFTTMSRQKLIRFQEIKSMSNVLDEVDILLPNKPNWLTIFNNNNPLILEVGCGRGEYSNQLASLNPDNNYIGLDLKGERIWQCATTSNNFKLKNTLFIRSQAQSLPKFFCNNQVSEIWLTFCDPQPNNSKQRLTNKRFLKIYTDILVSNGVIHLKTDSDLLLESMLQSISQFNQEIGISVESQKIEIEILTTDLYNSNYYKDELGITTNFEQKWSQKGYAIKYLKARIS